MAGSLINVAMITRISLIAASFALKLNIFYSGFFGRERKAFISIPIADKNVSE